MSHYSRTREIRSPEDLEEHFRAVEAYVSGADPETLFLRRVSKVCDQEGPEKLAAPERTYLALADLLGALASGRTHEYIERKPKALISSAAEGLSTLGLANLRASFEGLLREAQAPLLIANAEDREHEMVLLDAYFDLEQALIGFASRHRLF